MSIEKWIRGEGCSNTSGDLFATVSVMFLRWRGACEGVSSQRSHDAVVAQAVACVMMRSDWGAFSFVQTERFLMMTV